MKYSYYNYYRGKQFRGDFACISEIHSLLPKHTNVMALTATANVGTRKVVIKSLEMRDCYILSRNPNQLNTWYSVLPKPCDPISIFLPFINKLVCDKTSNKCLLLQNLR